MANLKKAWAFMAAFSLASLSFTACGGDTESGSSNGLSSSEASASQGSGREREGNLYLSGLPIVEEQETFTVAWPRDGKSIIGASEKDAVIKAEVETNIKIDWMEIESSAWSEKVNIILASQDLPDEFCGPIGDMIPANMDAFVDLTDYIEPYATALADTFQQFPVVRTYLTETGGSIRSLPTSLMEKPYETTAAIYWINRQWLEAVNEEMPQTIDEFTEVLRAFRDKDPNGNRQQDEIPFSFCNSYWAGSLSSMFGPFGILNPANKVLVKDGKVVFQPTQPGFREALEYFHSLYEEGLFDIEGFSQTGDQHNAKVSQTF